MKHYYGNSILSYIISLVTFILLYYLSLFLKARILKKIKDLASKTETKIDDVIVDNIIKIKKIEIIIISFYFSIRILPHLDQRILTVSTLLFLAVVIYRVIKIIDSLTSVAFESLTETPEESQQRSLNIIRNIIKIFLWLVGLLFLLHNAGFNIGSILTGIGIGGVAVALASQTILKDIFNFFVILLDKPFKIGDFILIQSFNISGVVEEIGLKTTKIKTLSGETAVITNSKITEEVIQNFSKMKERRVVVKISIVYNTPLEKIKEVNKIVEQAVKRQKTVRFDRANFVKFSDYSLDFEFVYYVLSSDYNQYLDINEKILLDIAESFKKHSIEFAYPTQSIYLYKEEK